MNAHTFIHARIVSVDTELPHHRLARIHANLILSISRIHSMNTNKVHVVHALICAQVMRNIFIVHVHTVRAARSMHTRNSKRANTFNLRK